MCNSSLTSSDPLGDYAMKKRSLREVRHALSVNRQGPTVGFVVPVPTVVKILAGSVYRYSYQAALQGSAGRS
jgi:hypothetical protein